MAIATRRVLPQHAREVRDQLADIARRVEHDSLNRGDQGDAVKDLQSRLRSFGLFAGKANGVFDNKTEEGVRRFQRRAGIVVDGVAGQQTLRAIRSHTTFVKDGFETAAHKGQRGADVAVAERMLKDLGFAPGAVDGAFTQKTAGAVRRFTAGDPTLPEKARIDANTFARMRQRYKKPLEKGDNTRGVRVVEENLQALGHATGKVDRHYSARTEDAVRAFQRQHGLERTGVADVKTRRALQQAVNDKPDSVQETLERFRNNPPKANYARKVVNSDGDKLNMRTIQMMERAEYIMRNKFGHKGFDFSVVQGSYSGSVSASGGTHDKGGAIDFHTRSYGKGAVDDMVKSLRMAGFAAWSRGRGADSFDPHIHAIAIGDRELSPSASSQVQEYFNGGNGLVGSALDADRHLGRPVPDWAKRFDR